MTWVKRRKGWRISCDVGEVTESLENEFCSGGMVIGENGGKSEKNLPKPRFVVQRNEDSVFN